MHFLKYFKSISITCYIIFRVYYQYIVLYWCNIELLSLICPPQELQMDQQTKKHLQEEFDAALEEKDQKITVLQTQVCFLCVHILCISQLSEVILKRFVFRCLS